MPIFINIGVDKTYVNNILKQMATIYLGIVNQYKFEYHTLFLARFSELDKNNQVSDETQLFINLKNTKKTQTDFEYIDAKSQFEDEIQNEETKDSG